VARPGAGAFRLNKFKLDILSIDVHHGVFVKITDEDVSALALCKLAWELQRTSTLCSYFLAHCSDDKAVIRMFSQ
jgi:hypothetical protein